MGTDILFEMNSNDPPTHPWRSVQSVVKVSRASSVSSVGPRRESIFDMPDGPASVAADAPHPTRA